MLSTCHFFYSLFEINFDSFGTRGLAYQNKILPNCVGEKRNWRILKISACRVVCVLLSEKMFLKKFTKEKVC